jgi:hypothetical protein
MLAGVGADIDESASSGMRSRHGISKKNKTSFS